MPRFCLAQTEGASAHAHHAARRERCNRVMPSAFVESCDESEMERDWKPLPASAATGVRVHTATPSIASSLLLPKFTTSLQLA